MPKAFAEWTVLPHGPIEKLAPNLWRVLGTLPRIPLRRNMVVARLSDGRLVINSPIALEEAAMKEIEAFGTPAYLVIPNGYHRLDVPAFQRRYPALRVIAPRGCRKSVEAVAKVDATFHDWPGLVSDQTVRLEPLQGIKDREGVMAVRSPDGLTFVFGDVVFNMDRKHDPLAFVITWLLGSAPGPRVSRLVKAVVVSDRGALRKDLERLAATPDLVRVIVAHEKLSTGADAAATLRQAATYL